MNRDTPSMFFSIEAFPKGIVYFILAYDGVYENVHICTKVCAQLRFVLPSDKNYIAHIADTKRSLNFFCVCTYLFSVYVYKRK